MFCKTTVDTYWATFRKIGLLFVPTSGHTVCNVYACIRPSYSIFFVSSFPDSQKLILLSMPMTGLKPRISFMVDNRSTNCTTTTFISLNVLCQVPLHRLLEHSRSVIFQIIRRRSVRPIRDLLSSPCSWFSVTRFKDIWRVFLVTLLLSPFHFIFSGPSVPIYLSFSHSFLRRHNDTATFYYSVLYFLFLHIFFASYNYFFLFTFSKKRTFSFSFLLTLSTTWTHKNIFVCFLFSNISFNSHNYFFFTAFSMSLSLCIVVVFLSFFASPLGLSSWLCRHISDDDGERYLVNVAMTKPS